MVAKIAKVQLHGYFAWFAWLFVHLINLVEYQNRVSVLIQWRWNYFIRNRSARMITFQKHELDDQNTEDLGDRSEESSNQTASTRIA